MRLEGLNGERLPRTTLAARVTGRVLHQQTLKNSIHCSGVGLHSGQKVALTLHPGEPDAGIVFVRADVPAARATVAAHWSRVVDTRMCSVIANEHGVRIGTIEHLMAAFAGCEIDNAVVELDGPEVPIMDGSAEPFVFLIECAGIVAQALPRRAIQVLRPVTAGNNHRFARLSPAPGFLLSMEIDFANTAVRRQTMCLSLTAETFKTELSRARTFGFLHEVDALRAQGLVRGGSLDNAVVVAGDRVLNEGGLRYADEFVRHKALDGIGDLYLAGAPICGHFSGTRTGHRLHHELLKALFVDDGAWTYTWLDADTGLALDAVGPSAMGARA